MRMVFETNERRKGSGLSSERSHLRAVDRLV